MSPAAFIEPCLPSPADKPPSGSNWIHEIKHDGYRLMAHRDPVGTCLLTRNGNDGSRAAPGDARLFALWRDKRAMVVRIPMRRYQIIMKREAQFPTTSASSH